MESFLEEMTLIWVLTYYGDSKGQAPIERMSEANEHRSMDSPQVNP